MNFFTGDFVLSDEQIFFGAPQFVGAPQPVAAPGCHLEFHNGQWNNVPNGHHLEFGHAIRDDLRLVNLGQVKNSSTGQWGPFYVRVGRSQQLKPTAMAFVQSFLNQWNHQPPPAAIKQFGDQFRTIYCY